MNLLTILPTRALIEAGAIYATNLRRGFLFESEDNELAVANDKVGVKLFYN